MQYTKKTVEEILDEGEVMFVLDSGVEYDVHSGNYEIGYFSGDSGGHFLETEGIADTEDGPEYREVSFPLSAIEHHYTHREL